MNGSGQQITPSAAFANWQQGGNGNPSTPIPQQIGAMNQSGMGMVDPNAPTNPQLPQTPIGSGGGYGFVPPMNQPTTNPAPMPGPLPPGGSPGGFPIFGGPQMPQKPPLAIDGPGFSQPQNNNGIPQLPQYTQNGQQLGSVMPGGHVIGTGQRYLNSQQAQIPQLQRPGIPRTNY